MFKKAEEKNPGAQKRDAGVELNDLQRKRRLKLAPQGVVWVFGHSRPILLADL